MNKQTYTHMHSRTHYVCIYVYMYIHIFLQTIFWYYNCIINSITLIVNIHLINSLFILWFLIFTTNHFCQTSTPAEASNTATAPSNTRKALSTSRVKSTWPEKRKIIHIDCIYCTNKYPVSLALHWIQQCVDLCTWCVYEVNPVILPVKGNCSWLDGDSSLPLLSHVISYSVTIIHI